MSNPNEPAKTLLPFLQRADELQKHEPLVAYYCRLYAMERGLKIPQSERTKTTNSILMSLINQLEKDKKSLNLSPDDNMHVEGFALNVFAKADKQDRAGRADLSTAKTFYAARIFFEILSQFGPVPPDIEQKQKYAAWKAADIRKAIKEGRNPTSSDVVVDDDNDLSIPSSDPSGSYDPRASDSNITSHYRTDPHQDLPPQNYQSHEPSHYRSPEPYHPSTHFAPAPTGFSSDHPPPYSSSDGRIHIAPVLDHAPSPTQKYHYDSSYEPAPEKIAEAHKAAGFAVKAFASDEISAAVEYLKKSLELLTYPSTLR